MIEELEKIRNKKRGIVPKRRNRNKKDEPEDESHVQYLAAMKIFEGRDFKQEKSDIMD